MTTPRRIASFDHDGLIFDVRDTGPLDGAVVVLLHGFPQTSTSWARTAALLNERGYRTIAPDQRGYSPRARPRGRFAYRSSRLVADTVALIRAIGAGPVHLVGHDWGANVAWTTAAQRPDLVRSLTTVSVPHSTAFLRAMLTSDQLIRSYYMFFFQLPWLPELAIRLQSRVLDRTLAKTGMTADQIDRVHQEILVGGALTGGLNWYRAMFLQPPTSLPTRVSVPTTHVWSDGDTALSRRGAELAGQYVDGRYRLEILTGVSHWVPEEAAATLAALIDRTAAGT
ncbi:alpha/beta fold hydrolase [Amycolatopsis regifaucium]|uniref:Alpha/beta hydrolase n=1 Tax=Amycolatopsis regifaucium TaxID=546365 RepID=A0A154MNM1_9PSEU|nr:alpha/beta fold hydrolase [Amycolatopsis regifaucium]KZB85922.1 alpha/beta hydrolase [Amycolatopsis regifaucium]OKA04814.1 alpha/beta hydrolase [Amycolatopsis regifaucium]SFH71705.1 Pimeloyl-ACP methyl ester carboxylesterase [Amycolatopsis regifaucium]